MIQALHAFGLRPCRRLAFSLKFHSIEEAKWNPKWKHSDAVNPDGSRPTGNIMRCGSCWSPIHQRDLLLRGRPVERDKALLRHARNIRRYSVGGFEWLR